MAGFTTERDLGTEGAGYADVGLKQAIEQGIVPGPRLLVVDPPIVARGAYGPKGFEPGVRVPQGAEEVSGADEMTRRRARPDRRRRRRHQDLRRLSLAPREPSRPTFTEAEMAAGVEVAHDAGRLAAAHATTAEGMRRAILAGVDTIEHGYERHARGVQADARQGHRAVPDARRVRSLCALFPALERPGAGARERPGEPPLFQLAMAAGVKICMGGDVGVFPHGENWLEMEAMRAPGCRPPQVHDRGDLGQCVDLPYRRPRRDPARPARRSGRGGRRSDPRHLGGRACPVVMKGGQIVRRQ